MRRKASPEPPGPLGRVVESTRRASLPGAGLHIVHFLFPSEGLYVGACTAGAVPSGAVRRVLPTQPRFEGFFGARASGMAPPGYRAFGARRPYHDPVKGPTAARRPCPGRPPDG